MYMTISLNTGWRSAAATILVLALCSGRVGALETEADRIVGNMSDYLGGASALTFSAEVTYDEALLSGQRLKYAANVRVAVRRPDRLRVAFDGDERKSTVHFDGSSVVLDNALKNLDAVAEVAGELDQTLDMVFEKYGLTVPIADFVYSDPYNVLTEQVQSLTLLGVHSCQDRRCYHIAATQESIDWQLWIQVGPHPVPRKFVITYKNAPGAPQYEARFDDWVFQPRLLDAAFAFHPPAGANEIDFLPRKEQEVPQ
jgi:hypothetical protein